MLLFLENAAAVLDDARARELANRTAAGLRTARRVDRRGCASWTRGSVLGVAGLDTGDSGVGQALLVRHALRGDTDALVRVAAATGDSELHLADKNVAVWLIESAVEDGDGPKGADSDRGPGAFAGGWCHGPAGTGRRFRLLAAVTDEWRDREIATKSANIVVASAAAAEKAEVDGNGP